MRDRVAIITGGTRGIGRAIAEALADRGAIPWLVFAKDTASAAEAEASVQKKCPQARTIQADLAQASEAERVVAEVLKVHGRLDILVNNAFRGGRPAKKIHETEVAAFDQDLTQNLAAPFYLSRAALPSMIAQKFGRIVLIGSLAMRGERGRVSYVVAKNGLVGLAKALALEYARDGITANVVSPGYVEAGAFMRLDPAIREAAVKRVPMGRAGQAQEIAAMVAHLCSDEASYTSGQVISVDGGVP
ncbi:MAG: SDR family oxidoreductase [Myxococcota bacterium]